MASPTSPTLTTLKPTPPRSELARIQSTLSKLTFRKFRPDQSRPPSASELKERLAKLDDELSNKAADYQTQTPTTPLKPTVTQNLTPTKNPGETTAEHDSGYASLASTPQVNQENGGLPLPEPSRKEPEIEAPKLRPFDKPIPKTLNDRFFDLRVLYSEPLWKAVSKRRSNPGDISMKLKYMGASEEEAKLYIVVQCDKAVSKKVTKFFQQAHVVEDLRSDFQVRVLSTGLLRLSNSNTLSVFGDLANPGTIYGMPIQISHNESLAAATLGGVIAVQEGKGKESKMEYYGLTAGHPLATILPAPSHLLPPLDFSDSDSSEDEEDDPSEDLIDIQLDLGHSFTKEYTPNDRPMEVRSKELLGTIRSHSMESDAGLTNRDWALVSITQRKSRAASMNGRGFSRAIIPASHLSPSMPEKALVLTAHGAQHGRLAANKSSIMMAPGKSLVEAYDFIPNTTSTLKPGDSGAWVVDEENGFLYGHLVSVDVFGEAYVMPIHDTLEDIKSHLKAEDVIVLPDDGVLYNSPPTQQKSGSATRIGRSSSNVDGRKPADNQVHVSKITSLDTPEGQKKQRRMPQFLNRVMKKLGAERRRTAVPGSAALDSEEPTPHGPVYPLPYPPLPQDYPLPQQYLSPQQYSQSPAYALAQVYPLPQECPPPQGYPLQQYDSRQKHDMAVFQPFNPDEQPPGPPVGQYNPAAVPYPQWYGEHPKPPPSGLDSGYASMQSSPAPPPR